MNRHFPGRRWGKPHSAEKGAVRGGWRGESRESLMNGLRLHVAGACGREREMGLEACVGIRLGRV